MAVRELLLTEDQWRFVTQLVNNAWHDADQTRMGTRPDSPQEKAAEADQLFIQEIRVKLMARDSVTPARQS